MAGRKNSKLSKKTRPLEPSTGKKGSKGGSSKEKPAKTSSESKKVLDEKNKKSETKKGRNKGDEAVSKPGMGDEIVAILLIAFGVFFVVALHTSIAGALGAFMADLFEGLFGIGAFIIAYFIIIYGFLILFKLVPAFRLSSLLMMLMLFLSVLILNSARFLDGVLQGTFSSSRLFAQGAKLENGGLAGMYIDYYLHKAIGTGGIYIVGITMLIVSLLMLLDTPVSRFFEKGRAFRETRRERRREKMLLDAESFDNLNANQGISQEQITIGYPMIEGEEPGYSEYDMDDKKNEEKGYGRSFLEKLRGLGENPNAVKEIKTDSKGEDKWDKGISKNKRNILNLVDSESENLGNENLNPHENLYGDRTDAGKGDSPGNKNIEDDFSGFVDHSGDFDKDMMIGGASVATAKSATENAEGEVSVSPVKRSRYKLPPLDILNLPRPGKGKKESSENLSAKAHLLEETLKSFGVDAKVVNVISGPSVTRYEIQPQIGVKVQSITRLTDDIALNMRARSIRIEAPIPGKAAVGIEIENEARQSVTAREILGSKTFRDHKSKLAFSVGRDIGGNPVVADLGKMPHLLIAGATGSGKSVCINTIIASILYKARPEEVKMILIDPKMVELGNYNGISHLLIPVVTDANKAASALNWAVAEMTDRYKKFAATGVRDIGAYNQKMKAEMKKEEILSQIVIIIDELSDLMMVASNQVEDAICRLAQLARAAGLHLIVATQRPSVDVITGLIKANIPSRIAFMVSSQIDSRTIIDMPGAEKLVGNGDMLFKPQDLNKPKRIQGPFISDDEVLALINYVKSQVDETQYDDEVIEKIEKGRDFSGEEEGDELLMDAVGVVLNAGKASVSMLQRRFRIGYNRAARILDIMESRGIVGPQDGSRPRQVLITEDEYESMRKEQGSLF